MSDTNVQTVNQDTLANLFPDLGGFGTSKTTAQPKFGMQETDINLFEAKPVEAQVVTAVQPVEGAKPADGAKPAEPANVQPVVDADILGDGVIVPATGTALSDLSTYYQDRIKTGKFVGIDQEDDKGNLVPFIPKTAEEYDEVLELQINYRLDQEKKGIQDKWYASKTPAWKAVSQYAELVDDPAQVIPFIQGVKTIQSVAALDENDADGAEQIVRSRLTQKGDTEEIITQQIDALKTTDKLISTAKLYKPVILQQEQQALQTQMKAAQDNERQYQQLVSEIRESALKSIETPVFGKTKLKNEEKAAIYDLIAEPSEETQGYGIYNVIDNLFEKKEFEKLKELALLLTNRDAFMNYLGTTVANKTAASLERKLRLAGEARSSSGNDFHEETGQPRVNRTQFKSKPTFGRSE